MPRVLSCPNIAAMRIVALVTAVLLALAAVPRVQADPADISAAARSVVRVVLVSDYDGNYSLEGHGSGFAVGPDLIITNAHVVEQARGDGHIRIGIVPSQAPSDGGGGGWFARIIAVAPEKDLALLKLTEAGSLPPATLFSGAVNDGEDVFAIGYPGNVDLAQGLNVGDIISPTNPVKTRGSVSSGRSSKQFDTILHTAPLGAGNSGGPLVDGCGRVVGANSFGTVANGGDSEFYFAVSAREIMRFLMAFQVKPRTAGNACRSFAEVAGAEAQRSAGQAARDEEAQRAATARQTAAREQAQQQAMFDVAAQRENLLAIAGVALLLATALGMAAWALGGRGQAGQARAAGIGAALLVGGAIAAMVMRPGFDQVDGRARSLTDAALANAGAPPRTAAVAADGALVCTLVPDRSRITVSDMGDVPLGWKSGGCVNAETQYAPAEGGGWTRLLVPDGEDTATLTRFDPATAEYRVDRYYPDLDAMARLRAARKALKAPVCGAGEAELRQFGSDQAGLVAQLPGTPNERLIYHCAATGRP